MCEHFYTLLTYKNEDINSNLHNIEAYNIAQKVINELDNLYSEKEQPPYSEVEKILERFPQIPFLNDDTNGKYK